MARRTKSFAKELNSELVSKYEIVDNPKEKIAYRPQPKQEELLEAMGILDWFNGEGPVKAPLGDNIGYGGAVFGGKSYGILGSASIAANAMPGVQMVFFRRTFQEMIGADSIITNAYEVFPGSGAVDRKGGMEWRWPNGSAFYFKHCQYDNDVFNYKGQGFDILFMDEATHFSWFQADYLLTRKRATCDAIIKPMAVFASNPGNIGHMWYMKSFGLDDPDWIENWEKAEEGKLIANLNGKEELVYFIPAFLEDNEIGVKRDPEYQDRLAARDEDTYQSLRFGLWDRFTGQVFRDFDPARHVITPFQIPADWPRWGAHDWGYDAPYVHHWAARDPDTGRIFVYREISGRQVTTKNQSLAVGMNTPAGEHVQIRYGDPSMWVSRNVDGMVKTAAQEFWENGIPLYPADNDRVNGVQKIHGLLRNLPDGKPGLQFFDTCRMIIKVMPNLVKSKSNPEDVQDMDGDDAYDCLRYLLSNTDMHRSRVIPPDRQEKKRSGWEVARSML